MKKQQPKVREMELPTRSYQLSRAELREKFEIPGADMETVREGLFTPIAVCQQNLKPRDT